MLTIQSLINQNTELFAAKDSDLGHTDTVTMRIDTGDHPPSKLRPYRTQLNNRPVIDKATDEMMEAGIISRSKSPYTFPVAISDKHDGTKRFCVDFRKLNLITNPLPLIDNILSLLGKAKYFTSLEFKSGYWQVPLNKRDKEKTAFACHRGLYEFNVMPFGLTSTPAVFQELMSIGLQGLDSFATAYLDDILIYSSSLDKHLDHIQIVFDRLRQHGLKLKLKKMSVLTSREKLFGFYYQ